MSAAGLVDPRKSASLGAFLAQYIAGRTDVRPRTTSNLKIAAKRMTTFFGHDKPMGEVTPADADAFFIDMKRKYATATTARTIKRAKQFYRAAIRGKYVITDPFEGIKPGAMTNTSRQFHVDREPVKKIMEACPDAEWRLIVALSRYGGIRCPSEHLALTWADINWAQDRFRVCAGKTEERWVPIFPELRPHLEERFEQAQDGVTHLITRYRTTGTNLRTQLKRIALKAGVKLWTKPFHNMRASRETELVAEYPMHVVCAWIGNSELVARKHYLTVREEDFARAAKSGAVRDFSGCTDEQATTEKRQNETNIGTVQPMKRENGIRCSIEYPRQDSNETQKASVFCNEDAGAAKSGAISHFTCCTRDQLIQAVMTCAELSPGERDDILEILGATGNARTSHHFAPRS